MNSGLTFILFSNTVLLLLLLSQNSSEVREGNAVYNLEVNYILILKLKIYFDMMNIQLINRALGEQFYISNINLFFFNA